MLEAAKFAPGGVEFAGHAEEVEVEGLDVLGGEREVVVAPAAGGERLEFEMGEVLFEERAVAGGDVSGVVEDGHVGAMVVME